MTVLDDALDFRRFGKWSIPGIPHKGWICIDTEDLGAPVAVCEMCEQQDIRYVHTMQHPGYPEVLRCGCICAGHMEEDVEQARQREARIKNTSRQRLAWPQRPQWTLLPPRR